MPRYVEAIARIIYKGFCWKNLKSSRHFIADVLSTWILKAMLDMTKAAEIDQILVKFLKEDAEILTVPLSKIRNLS